MDTKNHTIDAAGRAFGRVASEAARALMGKIAADYTPHIRSDVRVKIVNASKIAMRDKKRTTKVFKTYSGYPSGQKQESYQSLLERRGTGEPLRRAIRGMLPRNSMLKARLKNLEITA